MKAIRKTALAATGLVLALGLTACGGGDGKASGSGSGNSSSKGGERKAVDDSADKALKAADPVTALKAAAVKGAQQNTYRTKGKRKTKDGEFTSEGVFQVKPHAADMKDFGARTEDTPDGVNHIISVNGVMYGNTVAVPGKKWWSFELGKDKEKEVSEPFVRMSAALSTTRDVKNTGVETVGGRRAAHFQGTVVVSELSAYKGDAMKETDRDFYAKDLKTEGLEQIRLDVWVDKDGLVLKTEESGRSNKGEYRTSEEYSGFGEPVSVQAPPAADTAGLKESMEALAKKK
ncbi:hypothetical protein GCM10010218_39990 [Streptomyces mashuensis]|uniref:Lipoprotein n=1 Tax=Streptomyces mashuensis TaxID=33904 RepID=A0A919B5B8_9ACTN|nr:hypothetical protein [Streptomyces mashuensis]GHF54718.1 hypothetical protein GCM10010218_39990 [Streptomyces mashuensis]